MANEDAELLEELLFHSDRLTDEETAAFGDMSDGLTSGKWTRLTEKQRGWAASVAKRVGVDFEVVDTMNLVSSGKVKVKPEERASLDQFLGTLNRPLKPPGRRC